MFTIAAIAVMGGALFGSTFTAQLNATTFDVKSDASAGTDLVFYQEFLAQRLQ